MANDFLTDEQVEREIERLTHSEDVRLARMELRIKYKRRQYLYQLRDLEKRGKKLAAQGVTADTIASFMLGDADESEMCE